jgi:hypothetical protein
VSVPSATECRAYLPTSMRLKWQQHQSHI